MDKALQDLLATTPISQEIQCAEGAREESKRCISAEGEQYLTLLKVLVANHGAWLRQAEFDREFNCKAPDYGWAVLDYISCHRYMRAALTLFENGTLSPSQVLLRGVKERAYTQVAIINQDLEVWQVVGGASGEYPEDITKLKSIKYASEARRTANEALQKVMTSEQLEWDRHFNLDTHGLLQTRWEIITQGEIDHYDSHYSEVMIPLMQNAVLIFWMRHRLLPYLQYETTYESDLTTCWHKIDKLILQQDFDNPIRKLIETRFVFSPEDTRFRA